MKDFMGINTLREDPTDKLDCVGFVREFHDWENDQSEALLGYPEVLHVIEHPDSAGLACHVVQHKYEFPWPYFISAGLPHHPNYALGPEDPPCAVSVDDITKDKELAFILYPNPVESMLHIKASGEAIDLGGLQYFTLYDLSGRAVFSEKLDVKVGEWSFSLEKLPQGMYFYEIILCAGWIWDFLKSTLYSVAPTSKSAHGTEHAPTWKSVLQFSQIQTVFSINPQEVRRCRWGRW